MNLIEKLENYRDAQTDYEATLADAVIDSCIDIVKQHQAESWVSVDKRLPDEDGRYLVHLKNGLVTTDIYVRHSGQWVNYDIIKNWQPLPQPPSEVQDDSTLHH